MAKFRIREIKKLDGSIYYGIQEKFLFFWKTLQDDYGYNSSEFYDLNFNTVADAQKHIDKIVKNREDQKILQKRRNLLKAENKSKKRIVKVLEF